jgi:hypothetical protein
MATVTGGHHGKYRAISDRFPFFAPESLGPANESNADVASLVLILAWQQPALGVQGATDSCKLALAPLDSDGVVSTCPEASTFAPSQCAIEQSTYDRSS